jgi:acyl-CoA thioester hydrolase
MAATFHTTRRVEFVDTDMAGIAHFSNFFRWMESAEVDFLHARGLSVKVAWEGATIGFPRVAASCDYLSPVRFEDVLDIDVTIERLGTKSVSYVFEFQHRGRPVARGKMTAVSCRVREDGTIESVAIPTSLRERLLAPA